MDPTWTFRIFSQNSDTSFLPFFDSYRHLSLGSTVLWYESKSGQGSFSEPWSKYQSQIHALHLFCYHSNWARLLIPLSSNFLSSIHRKALIKSTASHWMDFFPPSFLSQKKCNPGNSVAILIKSRELKRNLKQWPELVHDLIKFV